MSEVASRRKPGPKPLLPALVRSAGVKAMLTANEAQGLQALADEAGLSLSDYLRRLVQSEFSRYLREEDA